MTVLNPGFNSLYCPQKTTNTVMWYLFLQLTFPLGVCAAPCVPLADGNNFGVYKLYITNVTINVREEEALLFFSLNFELAYKEEGIFDGMGPATGNYWCSVVLKEGAVREKVFTRWCKLVLQMWNSVEELGGKGLWITASWSWSRRSREGMTGTAVIWHCCLLASSRWACGNCKV